MRPSLNPVVISLFVASMVIVGSVSAKGGAVKGSCISGENQVVGAELVQAVISGSVKKVEKSLFKGADVNYVYKHSNTPLLVAVENGHTKVVERLLCEEGIRLNHKNQYGDTALSRSEELGHKEIVKMLIQCGADVNEVNGKGDSVLLTAARKGHLEIVDAVLCARTVELDSVNVDGDTALLLASRKGHDKIVQVLLQKHANICVVNQQGETALLAAAKKGHVKVATLLLASGAKANHTHTRFKTKQGAQTTVTETPLALACKKGHKKMVELLLENGAGVDVARVYIERNSLSYQRAQTPLVIAARKGHRKVVELLLEKGADVNCKGSSTMINSKQTPITALEEATWKGHTKVVELLVEKGAHIHRDLLLHAAVRGHTGIVKKLLCSDEKACESIQSLQRKKKWKKSMDKRSKKEIKKYIKRGYRCDCYC